MTTRFWDGTTGAYSSISDWLPNGVPAAGDTAIISSGTVTIGRSDLVSALTLRLTPTSAAFMVKMQNTAILPTDEVDLLAGKNPAQVYLALLGTVENFGAITAQADGNGVAANTDIAIGTLNGSGGTFFNFGRITLENGNSVIMSADGNSADSLVNDGVIKIDRPGTDLIVANFFMTVLGSGMIEIGAGAIVVMQGVGAGQTISFDPQGSLSAQLTIEQKDNVGGLIAGFGANDTINLDTAPYDSMGLTSSNGVTTLAFLSGGAVIRSLQFQGTYTKSQFSFFSTPAVAGTETTIIRGVTGTSVAGAQTSTSLKVFRFVDTTTGTHFYTDDPNEAATVSNARPDLTIEGVGFNAVNPAAQDPNAAPVYRFFETTDGTHFFTASASEKTTIIATRPDLVFEPTSTVYEHTTAQAGDVPVYRFFDSIHGTHFYTASSAEQASIVATRPDLVTEGVAFYAPGS